MNFQSLFLEKNFDSFTLEHYLPIAIILFLGIIISLFAKYKLNEKQQRTTGVLISLIPLAGILGKLLFNFIEGFQYKLDLPLHVCNVLALIGPYLMWSKNRFLLGIAYFWIFAGTLNANITPDIQFGYPHWQHLTYMLMHAGLLLIPIYALINYDLKINWKDLKNAFWGANLFLIFSLTINYLLGSNYMYTISKPEAQTIVDYMGPWPWYLLTGQVLALVLFLILYIPYIFKRSPSK